MAESMLTLLGMAAACYVGLGLLVFVRQGAYVYYPDRDVAQTPAAANIRYEDVRLRTADGETLAAWYLPAWTPGDAAASGEGAPVRPTVLVLHGNAGDIGDRVSLARVFHGWGCHVLMPEYRGYGKSSGKPTEKGTYADAMAAWTYLTETRGTSADSIVVYGRSLGGAVAAWLAAQVRPAALAIDSTFTSAPDMAKRMFAYLPRFICRFRYDTRAQLGNVACPVFVAHSRQDEMIPFEHGRLLFDAAPEPKTFLELNGGHNAGGLENSDSYQRALHAFVQRHVPGAAGEKGSVRP